MWRYHVDVRHENMYQIGDGKYKTVLESQIKDSKVTEQKTSTYFFRVHRWGSLCSIRYAPDGKSANYDSLLKASLEFS